MVAAQVGNAAAVELLLAHGADPSVQSDETASNGGGLTALHLAVTGFWELCKYDDGLPKSPWVDFDRVVQLLVQRDGHGCALAMFTLDDEGFTPLSRAIVHMYRAAAVMMMEQCRREGAAQRHHHLGQAKPALLLPPEQLLPNTNLLRLIESGQWAKFLCGIFLKRTQQGEESDSGEIS